MLNKSQPRHVRNLINENRISKFNLKISSQNTASESKVRARRVKDRSEEAERSKRVGVSHSCF